MKSPSTSCLSVEISRAGNPLRVEVAREGGSLAVDARRACPPIRMTIGRATPPLEVCTSRYGEPLHVCFSVMCSVPEPMHYLMLVSGEALLLADGSYLIVNETE